MNFLIKQRLEKMEQGDDIEMSIDMDRQCVTWRVKNSSATEDIPEELKGTVLVPFVSLYNTDDSLQFVEKR